MNLPYSFHPSIKSHRYGFKNKGKISFVYINTESLYQKEGEITEECFKGPNCKQTEV